MKKHVDMITNERNELEKIASEMKKQQEILQKELIKKDEKTVKSTTTTDVKKAEEKPKEKAVEKKVDEKKGDPSGRETVMKKFTDEEIIKMLDDQQEGEICLISTVVGCRESKDRIEFAMYLKDFVDSEDAKESKGKDDEEKKSDLDTELSKFKPSFDYKLVLSEGVKQFIRVATVR